MINISKVTKSFGKISNQVLSDISFTIKEGELISLTGRSGSGKSTLLYIISTLDFPTSGEVLIDDLNTQKADSRILHDFRNRQIGFVFQFHHLLPELTALENIFMPARKTKRDKSKTIIEYADSLLDSLNLSKKRDNYPSQLSGGEQQRVAIARALILKPKYIFADEPTGNLDSSNGNIVMDIFKKINKEDGTTVIYVTHDQLFASLANRQITLVDGKME